jgi:hypothetical protein
MKLVSLCYDAPVKKKIDFTKHKSGSQYRFMVVVDAISDNDVWIKNKGFE